MHLSVAQRRPHLIRFAVILGLFSIAQASTYWNSSLYAQEANTSWNWAANFISDLGRTTWYNGMNAPIEQRLWFLLGMTCLGATVGLWFQQGTLRTQALGWLSGTSFLGVALLPADLVRWPHRVALLLGLILTMLAAFNSLRSHFANQVLALVPLVYLAFLVTYPLPEASNQTALTHSLVQKLVILIALLAISLGTTKPWKTRP